MRKIERLAEKAKAVAGNDLYAFMGWAILEGDGSWTARLDTWGGRQGGGKEIKTPGYKTEEECLEAVYALIDQYPPRNPREKVTIIIDDMMQ